MENYFQMHMDTKQVGAISNLGLAHIGDGVYELLCRSWLISRGGKTLEILNSDFEIIASYQRTDKTGYTAQGMGSDDHYLYFPMSFKDRKNIVVVYDWDGNYITTVKSDVTREAESMFWVNGKYYFAHNYFLEGMNVWEGEFTRE